MIRLVTVIGARPQFIKAAALSRAFAKAHSTTVREVIVHTGQHYDENMSSVFFDEMGIPRPDYMLEAGSGLHGKQTALMTDKIEEVLLKEKPDGVILYGDTNSTLAGALAASKLYLPIAHVEAGLRSFNKRMPEEINRILCDHVSTFLFCPTETGVQNLAREGFRLDATAPHNMDNPKVYHCGDVMFDNTLHFAEMAKANTQHLARHGLTPGGFLLVTIHRNTNTDDPLRLEGLLSALLRIADHADADLVFPVHPRTRGAIERNLSPALRERFANHPRLKLIPPASFLEMTALEAQCSMVITDSGGVQKEAYFLQKPCIVLRPETEWVELLDSGSCLLADADPERIWNAYLRLSKAQALQFPPLFGDGHAAEFIVDELVRQLGQAQQS
jgi:UDP-GlcNAc3NAcA epimerase